MCVYITTFISISLFSTLHSFTNMHIHSLALLATTCLLSITGHAAPLVIKRDNQQQGGTVTGLTTQTTGLEKSLGPITDPFNEAIASFFIMKAAVEGVAPANGKGVTADKQATAAVNKLATALDNATGSGGKKQN